ncbi:methyltransferase domain-containing protein [Actinoplanes sp. NPDC026623]|uniref:class I SAM-dependent methyltransferase n=1 Tax=Actinoplanes sp. NPDC026623 TaxID=3155610 RepID=UPI0033D2B1F9
MDPEDLKTFYEDPTLLRDRQRTYAVPLSGRSFVEWVLDLLDLEPVRDVLDAGAGVGRFTIPIARRLAGRPARVVACDLFGGMLETIAAAAAQQNLAVDTRACDIQALPFDADGFDLVLANHVLYHLPDIDQGVRELARVTRPAGTLVATTNADDIPVAVVDLHLAALDRIGFPSEPEGASAFSLRSGGEVLRKSFREVRTHTFRDQQVFDGASSLVAAYCTTGRFRAASGRAGIGAANLVRAAEAVASEWVDRRGGRLVSPIVMGAFVCTGPRVQTGSGTVQNTTGCLEGTRQWRT